MIIKTGRDLGTIVIDADGGEDIIEQIAKHGLGHALGLGHANYDGSLMADLSYFL
jgi:predicted Zn-dependent protease